MDLDLPLELRDGGGGGGEDARSNSSSCSDAERRVAPGGWPPTNSIEGESLRFPSGRVGFVLVFVVYDLNWGCEELVWCGYREEHAEWGTRCSWWKLRLGDDVELAWRPPAN